MQPPVGYFRRTDYNNMAVVRKLATFLMTVTREACVTAAGQAVTSHVHAQSGTWLSPDITAETFTGKVWINSPYGLDTSPQTVRETIHTDLCFEIGWRYKP
jgi:N-methylhydantoinase B/oxoprolinase/acetone carboxylase alpha subunit